MSTDAMVRALNLCSEALHHAENLIMQHIEEGEEKGGVMGYSKAVLQRVRHAQATVRQLPPQPPLDAATQGIVGEMKKKGLCGHVFMDEDGVQMVCILKAPCEKHP